MATQLSPIQTETDAAVGSAAWLGYAAAIALTLFTVVALAIGIATPPRSGPWCTGPCIAYPYDDAGRFFPRDYYWMGPALLLAPLFLVIASCVHFCAKAAAKPLSLVGVCFSAMAAMVISLDYFVQLLVIQPGLERQQTDGVALLTQYNPHGIFIALEDLGYLLLGAAFLFVGAALPREIKPGRRIRWLLIAAAALAYGSFFEMARRFGMEMAVPAELALIAIDWLTLIVAGILFAMFFRKVAHGAQI